MSFLVVFIQVFHTFLEKKWIVYFKQLKRFNEAKVFILRRYVSALTKDHFC